MSFRCRVTGLDGTVIDTNTVKAIEGAAPLTIMKQPEDQTCAVGATVAFTVEAENASSYQWQWSPNGTTWKNCGEEGAQTDTFEIVATAYRMTLSFRCRVTGLDGTVIDTNTVKAKVEDTFVIDNVQYHVLDNGTTAEVSKYLGDDSSLTIPSSISYNGITYEITKIGESAFENHTELVSISLPNSITIIGKKAFKGCTSLSQMNTH